MAAPEANKGLRDATQRNKAIKMAGEAAAAALLLPLVCAAGACMRCSSGTAASGDVSQCCVAATCAGSGSACSACIVCNAWLVAAPLLSLAARCGARCMAGPPCLPGHHLSSASWTILCLLFPLSLPCTPSLSLSSPSNLLPSPLTPSRLAADKAQWYAGMQAKKGEGDRHIPDLMPKHLFSGKRPKGSTDRR